MSGPQIVTASSSRQSAADVADGNGSTSEEEAIDELKSRYANGDLSDREFEEEIDDVLTSDDPEQVLEAYERE